MLSRIRKAGRIGRSCPRQEPACGLRSAARPHSGGRTTWFIVELRRHEIAHAKRELKQPVVHPRGGDGSPPPGVGPAAAWTDRAHAQLGIDSPENVRAADASHARCTGSWGNESPACPTSRLSRCTTGRESGQLLPRPGRLRRSMTAIGTSSRRMLAPANPPKTVHQPTVSGARPPASGPSISAGGFEAPDGQLIGIVVSTIHDGLFRAVLFQDTLSGDGSFALYRSDGMLLARYPHVDPKIGKTFGLKRSISLACLRSLDHGVARITSLLDGKDRLIAGT